MILLLGASGYIGSAFAKEMLRRAIPFIPLKHTEHVTPWCFDNASLVINCAAYITRPSVDLCEDHKEECVLGNLMFPIKIRDECERAKVPLIHISTGCLYNGDNSGKGWSEEDPAQLTFNTGAGTYVGCKQLAEQEIKRYDKAYCCRIRLPFDEFDDARNYISKLIRYERTVMATNSITHRGDFVKACLDLWKMRAPFGVYNMTNPGFVTTAKMLDAIRCDNVWPDHLDWPNEPWALEDFEKNARTKKSNCVLDTTKLLATGVKMRSVSEALEHSIKNWVWEKTYVPPEEAVPGVRVGQP